MTRVLVGVTALLGGLLALTLVVSLGVALAALAIIIALFAGGIVSPPVILALVALGVVMALTYVLAELGRSSS
jgi:hypothetical protein